MNAAVGTRPTASPRWVVPATLLFVVLAALLRFGWIGHQFPLDDEWHALHAVIQFEWHEIVNRFGRSDHSIPIALMLEALSETRGLNEWNLGLPFALFGLIAVVLVPRLLRDGLLPAERVALTGLLALSPLLFYYSQQARPYAPLTVLLPLALVALWRFRAEGGVARAAVFGVAGALAVWLHPLVLVWLCWALLVAALMSAFGRGVPRSPVGAARMVAAGFVMALLAGALLAGPLIHDFAALMAKTGRGEMTLEGSISALRLALGVGSSLLLAVLLGVAAWGGAVLVRRGQGAVLGWVLALSAGALVTIALTNAAWLHHGLVLVRYSIPAQLGLLVLLAIGACDLAGRAGSGARAMAAIGLPLLLVLAGPLPRTLGAPNAMVEHLYWQFDYNDDANKVRTFLDGFPTPEVDRRIAAAEGPGRVWYGPWRFESHSNLLVRSQRVQGRALGIVMLTGRCFDFSRGEFPDDARFRMNHMVPFARLETVLEPGDFVVFPKRTPLPDARVLDDYSACLDEARARFGEPWFEDDDHLAFRRPSAAG